MDVTENQAVRKICIVTANRADYSRLRPIMRAIDAHEKLQLQLVVTGSHVLTRFGSTLDVIRSDGFEPDCVLSQLIEGETPVTAARSVGLQMIDMGAWFDNNRPDIVVIMGDRFDMAGVAMTASLMNIPIAHVQGGEETGSVDEALRHAITKLSHIHFPSTDKAKETIVRMGEAPSLVFNFGCPSVDQILKTPIPPLDETLRMVEDTFTTNSVIDPNKPYILAIQHPVVTEYDEQPEHIEHTLDALYDLGMQVIFLWPNVDAGASHIVQSIRRRIMESNPLPLIMVKNLEQDLFLALMAHATCMVGNSSAGIREACYFGTPVVNIGTRQSNRERGANVVDVPACRHSILNAMKTQLSHGSYPPEHLYGCGNAGEQIAATLANIEIPSAQKCLVWTT